MRNYFYVRVSSKDQSVERQVAVAEEMGISEEYVFIEKKSFFEIDACKTIKKERLECHLYGQLIGILLCSSTMFQMRKRKTKN